MRTPSGLASGAGEEHVERDHVREHGVGTRLPSQLGRELAQEAERPTRARAGAEGRRTRTFAGSVGCEPTDWQSTTSSSTRAASARDEVERLCEHRVLGVERLRDEDEPHQRDSCARRARGSARARARPASRASRRTAPPRPHPAARRARGRARTLLESLRERVGVGRRHEEALDPIVDEVGDAAAVRRDDRPAARERLDDDPAEALRPGRQHEHGRLVDASARRRPGRATGGARHDPGSPAQAARPRRAASPGRRSPAAPREGDGASTRHALASPSTFL